jgi:amphi-Trp domain-containing protein
LTLDDTMTGFKHEERVSRRQAAERPADIAFALTAGETLELRAGGERLKLRVADDLLLRRRGKATGDHVSLDLELSRLA